jgi:hypothetical protein
MGMPVIASDLSFSRPYGTFRLSIPTQDYILG